MKREAYIKSTSTFLVLCLLIVLVQRLTNSNTVERVQAATAVTQAWEYKHIVVQTLDWKRNNFGDPFLAESAIWYEDGTHQSSDFDPSKVLGQLGQQGWELVSVVPQATLFLADRTPVPLTSRVSYYFRRPKH